MKRHGPWSITAWLAGAAAVLPLAALSAATPATESRGFTPPATELVLTRVLHSPLVDGKEVVARRSYAVRIVPDGEGFRVDGELLNSEVDAPPSLSALAEIERNRPETGLFPMRLDGKGMLLPATGAEPTDAVQNAAAIASRAVNSSTLGQSERAEARAFIAQVQGRAAGTTWPANLFRAEPGRRVEEHLFPLPDGSEGRIIVEVLTKVESAPGVVTRLERTVVTEMGDSRRVTREEWTISKAG